MLLLTPMLVLHLRSTDQDQERMRYTFLVHHVTRESQTLVIALCQRHDQWIRALLQYSPTSCVILAGAGIDPAVYKGDVVADYISNNVDDQDTPSCQGRCGSPDSE